ncbi:MAG: DNA-processing protein DprA [Candidatus Paceibacterota bacterium]
MFNEIKSINIDNSKYPSLLKKIDSPPENINYKGSFDNDLFSNCLAVVGTRRITSYGKRVVKKIVSEVASAGVTIVSGFMFGVDYEAHKIALESGGRTVAVMPCGVDVIHPNYQEELYKNIIINKGCILSEFPNGHPPLRWTYSKRNRIVAGLSKVVLVIEGSRNSGTLITARYAKKYNRKLTAIPSPITSDKSFAGNSLIKNGAELIMSSKDILSFFDKDIKKNNFKDDKEEGYLIEELKREPMTIEEIRLKTGISVRKLNISLSQMEVDGRIKEDSGKYFLC